MNKWLSVYIFLLALCFVKPAAAEPVTQGQVDKAQGEMIKRVSDAVARYAKQINVDAAYVSYCDGELYLKTHAHPANGYIPFGVNYRDIKDSERLELVISSREAYEKSFMTLCLANAKNALQDAERR
ncbi:MAG: hypothetical protein ACREVY_00700 [Gammaproteobacteria bacterium]